MTYIIHGATGAQGAPVHAALLRAGKNVTAAVREPSSFDGAAVAVDLLGRKDGFFGDPKVRIPLPGFFKEASKLLKMAGQGQRIDELELSMNRAAEAAVPQARSLLLNAVKTMNVADAKQILTGGDDSATRFFADKTRQSLSLRFLPIVARHTERVALTQKYNALASKAAAFGLLKAEDVNLQQYVTGKALDGLYLVIGEEERKIRNDPVGSGSAILKQVFGGLK